MPGLRQQIQRHTQACQNKGELTNLRQAGGDGQSGTRRVAKHPYQEEGGNRLTKDNNRQGAHHGQRLLNQNHRIKQHPDGDKEQDGEGVAQRQRIVRRTVAQLGFVQHHPGEERAQCKGDVEQFNGTKGNPQRQGKDRQGKQLTGAGGRAAGQDPRHQTAAHQHHNGDKRHHFPDGDAHVQRQCRKADALFFHHTGDGRQQHQRQHHHQVFHNQPAYRDLSALAVDKLPLLKRAQQYDGTGG